MTKICGPVEGDEAGSFDGVGDTTVRLPPFNLNSMIPIATVELPTPNFLHSLGHFLSFRNVLP